MNIYMEKSKDTSELGYAGTVRIALKRGKTTLWEKTAHNSGKKSLFKFIAQALTGELNKSLLPKMIRLFGKETAEEESKDVAANESTWQFTELLAASPLVHAGAAGIAESDSQSATAVLTFRIPGAMISGNFCKLALYPLDPSDPADGALATIGLTKTTDGVVE